MGPRREWRSRAREGRARSRRDRFGSVPRSVRFRVEIGSVRRRRARGPGPRGGHFGASPTTPPSDSRRNVDLDGGEAVRRREPFPHERRTARPARARPAPRGRTRRRTVVPRSTGSYPMPRGRTLKPPYSTTRRRSVRPHEPGYDRPEATAAGPVGRTTARATAPPHNPPTAPDPTRPITPTPRPRPPTPTASRTARPSDNHHPPPAPPRTTPPHNHDNEPNSSRNRTELDGEDRESTAARRPPCGGRRAAVTRTRAATA